MADANNANRSDLEATGSTAPELQHKGGEPTPAAGTFAEPGDQPETDSAEYAKLLDFYDSSFRNIAEGEVVKGTVLKVTDSEVIVDVGYKSEGIIGVQEFLDENGQVTVQPGDIVDVLLERTEDRDGYVVLSREKAEKMKIWDEIEKAYADRKVVIGRVIERIKGGLAVDIGVRAFLPGSQVDVRPVRNLDALKNQELRMRVIKVNKKRGNIVLSRKVLLEEENAEKKKFTLATLAEGKVLRGVVKNITDYGAFIDLGGIDGLLHITDMSWGRVGHPSEIFKIGDRIKVKVLNFDPEKERISLGLKQLETYPWEGVDEKYKVGDRIKGKVVSITDYGAFIELEKGVEGLIHVSEMSWTRHVRHPSKVVNIGDIIEAVVLKVDKANEKISLGLKQVEPDPWLTLDEKYPAGMRVRGKVRNLTNFGAFVELEEGIDGLVHVSDMSWTKRVAHPSEVLKKGDSVEVVILSIDKEHRRISLGLKQVSEDPWPQLADKFPAGMVLAGTINRLFDRGAIVDLGGGIEGFVPLSQLGIDDLKRPNDAFEVGEALVMKVTRVDVANHRLILSVKAWLADQDDIALAEWTSKRNQVRARIAANPPAEEPAPTK